MSTIVLVLPVSQVAVNAGRAVMTATVTNNGTKVESIVLGAFPPAGSSAGTGGSAVAWTTVERSQRDVQPGATEQFNVTIEPSAGAAAGTYPVRFIAYSAYGAPEESADQARQVDVVLPMATPVAAPPTTSRWWIYAVAAALVLIVGAVAFLVLRPEPDPCADGSCFTPSPSPTPTPPVPTPVVEGINWTLSIMSEGDIAEFPAPAKITLRIDGDRVSGKAGCQPFSGTWIRTQDTLQLSDMTFTYVKNAFCPAQVALKANRFKGILPDVTSVTGDEDSMELLTDDFRSLFFEKS
jgi:heat shock protein HslJ